MIGQPNACDLYDICGIPISVEDTMGAARRVVEAASDARSLQVHLCNAFTLSLVDSDSRLRTSLGAGDLNLADGAPVAWLGRRHGVTGPVRGAALVGEVVRLGDPGLRHYLYGGKEGVAELMAAGLERSVPGVSVVGTECPPFRQLTDTDVAGLAERVRASGANVLWIGLGTPRQDYLVHELAPLLPMPVIPVGAAFDFWSGAVKEAPKVLQGSGFEWVFRLASEPRRLWRRYLIGNPRFVWSAWRHHHRHER
jgi:N-acetylglucosaminyldiphosphoundecaprenol N-acetyl-beta-D-mannosaminyltransferase